MPNSSQPSPASVSDPSGLPPVQSPWAAGMEDVAFGCECANPALQIAGWRQEASEPVHGGGASS